jgi:predicted ribosome quality control (RQC) complex YloA/Tae2 family protein
VSDDIGRRMERNHPDTWDYELPGGWIVWAGKTERDNDRLSIKVARGKDWWFHVRGMPGSHVLLLARDGEEPSGETLKAAAAVAAWHSKGRTGGTVAVSACLARNVSKPRGAKPGTVTIRQEKVLKVRPALP